MGKKDDYQFDYLDDNDRFATTGSTYMTVRSMIHLRNIIRDCVRCLNH